MVKQGIIKVINDLALPINYVFTINEKVCKPITKENVNEYNFSCQEVLPSIKIFHEDKWGIQSKLNWWFMVLYSLDLVWGNVFEGENLLIGIDYVVKSTYISIKLSEIISVAQDSIKNGKNVLFCLMIIIAFMLFMLLPHPLNTVLGIISFLFIILLSCKTYRRFITVKSQIDSVKRSLQFHSERD